MKKYIGIDIGGTKCAVVLGDAEGRILKKVRFPTQTDRGPQQAIDRILQAVAAMHPAQAAAIGVSCGGPLDSVQGTILSPPNLPGWDHIEIKRILEERFGRPAYVQNDANACTVAEWQFGAARGKQNVIFLTCGTGMGAGLILDGRLYEGRDGAAGEIGHVRMSELGPAGFGKPGSFEGLCSGSGIRQLGQTFALAALQQGERPAYCPDKGELMQVTAASIAQAAEAGDATAQQVYQTVGAYLGRGIAILIDVLNPDIIVLGSIFGRSEELLRRSMEESIRREAIGASICPVVPAALGEHIGDYGALCTGMRNGYVERTGTFD